jgi:23S rRNA (adenine2503-C2)-methyltransferase
MEETKKNLLDLSVVALEQWMEDHGEQRYRGRQVFNWLYQKLTTDLNEMTDLPAKLRQELHAHFSIDLPGIVKHSEAADGAVKFLFGLADSEKIEAVLLPDPEKKENTLCVSVQVGCKFGCGFCATGTLGFKRDLTAGEIAGQLLAVLKNHPAPFRVHRLVLMGMGEALDNFDQVKAAFEIFTAKQGLGFSPRRITVSTAGVAPRLLDAWALGANLAVSLNASENEKRSRLMPINKKYPLPELVAALRKLDTSTRQKLTVEYVMLKGVNDSNQDAERLAFLLAGINVRINLIRFNAFPGCEYSPSDEPRVLAFQDRLKKAGFMTFIRKSKGREISGACGQLAGGA